jgi:4-hydroxybenzoate polyprenyltransferase
MKGYINLLRVKQWYKNIVIFIPLIFAGELFNITLLNRTIVGLIALCFVSSANYIINDIVDRKRDIKNPEKRDRPIASGRIKVLQAVILGIGLLLLGLYISLTLSLLFFTFVLLLFIIAQLYSFMLKNKPLVDVLTISINFVLRTVSGAFVTSDGLKPYIQVSPWLLACPFFLALFLATSKKHSELILLGKSAYHHNIILPFYIKIITNNLMILTKTLLIICYSFYTFFGPYKYLIFSLPFVFYIISRFYNLAQQGSDLARHPELLYQDKRIMFSSLVVMLIVYFAIYVVG